jgi:hypothetical protein
MPLGIISESEFLDEIKGLKIELPRAPVEEVIIPIERGRPPGRENVDEEVREEIAKASLMGVSNQELMNIHNVSQSSVSAYKNGATSTATYNTPNQKIISAKEAFKEEAVQTASQKLMRALGAIDLSGAIKPGVASGVAKDMSVIIKNMTSEAGPANVQQVLIYQPRKREEESYDVIEVQE